MKLDAVQDAKDGKYYVFANEGDIYTDASGNEFSYVTVIDTQAAAVRSAPSHVSHGMYAPMSSWHALRQGLTLPT